MTLEELFTSPSVQKWTQGPAFYSEYSSVDTGIASIICAYRIKWSDESHWTYNLTYISTNISSKTTQVAWEDLDWFTAHCVFVELWKQCAWYVKLYHYLRSKYR